MPDLTEMSGYECKSYTDFETTVRGRSGTHTVRFGRHGHNNPNVQCDWSCSCKSFKYQRGVTSQGYCKHIRRVVAQGTRCGWNERFDAGEVVENEGIKSCPKCGGEVVVARWAV